MSQRDHPEHRNTEALFSSLKEEGITLLRKQPLASFTGFKAGGAAELFLEAESWEDLAKTLAAAAALEVPVSVLGFGSNVLVSDEGVPGLCIRIGRSLSRIYREGEDLICEAGAPLWEAAASAAREGLSGLEALAGIPGSVGGAIYMNAGAYEHSVSEITRSIEYLDKRGERLLLSPEDFHFSYRKSFFSDVGGIVARVRFHLREGDSLEIYRKMAEYQEKRRRTQPLHQASAGSSFKRPEGYFAGRLISDSGLKGWRKGNCGVSGMHAGFIVNYGGASAREIYEVFQYVRQRVQENSGVLLEPEVKPLGEWGDLWNS